MENLGMLGARIGVAVGSFTRLVRLDLAVGVEWAVGPETESRV